MLSSAYDLPFDLMYSPAVLSKGVDVNIRVVVGYSANYAAIEEAIRLFAALANIGCLGGGGISSDTTGVRNVVAHTEGTGVLNFELCQCTVADEALIVLSHLLLALHPQHPIISVEVTDPDRRSLQRLLTGPESTYPARSASLPFPVEDTEPEGGGYSFNFEFEEPLDGIGLDCLNAVCRTWVGGILAGGYGLASVPPEKSYIEPDADEVTAYDSVAEWAVFKVVADPDGCLAGFLNALAAFHVHQQRIIRLEIL